VSRLVMWAGILGIAIVVVFAVPFLFRGLGGSPAGSPSPIATALASPTAEPSPTPEPVATPLVYTVKSGDTLSKIATKYKVTVDKILEANPKITNANKIQPGDKITIPTPPPDEVVDEGEITPAP
jgi:LysM repeat protein